MNSIIQPVLYKVDRIQLINTILILIRVYVASNQAKFQGKRCRSVEVVLPYGTLGVSGRHRPTSREQITGLSDGLQGTASAGKASCRSKALPTKLFFFFFSIAAVAR
ncbi:hypothetical protein ACMYSQ_009587 [Aspergillus niger]